MKSLPEDVIISILAKLEVKPLMRFRCVCKWWYHLIKSPNFIEMHQRSTQNKRNESILIKYVRDVNYKTDLSFYSYESLNEIPPYLEVPHFNDNDKEDYQVSWPCNGLLLCVVSDSNDDYRSKSVLFNPATKESKLLPPSPFYHVHRGERLWVSFIGLGFDSNQNDYKVVIIDHKIKAQIYNLSSNSWRQIEQKMPMPVIYSYGGGLPLNGALHWRARRNKIDIILSFDVSTEVFQDINLPEVIAHYVQYTYNTITLLNDCLAMFIFDTDNTTFVDIWVMKVGSWMKQISISGLVNNIVIRPCMIWNNEAILCNISDHNYWKLKLLALDDTHEITDTGISHYDRQPSVMLYKESLVSIN